MIDQPMDSAEEEHQTRLSYHSSAEVQLPRHESAGSHSGITFTR